MVNPSESPLEPLFFKPAKRAFFYYKFLLTSLFLLFFCLVGAFVLQKTFQDSYLAYLLGGWALVSLFFCYWYWVRYQKEEYWIYPDRLIAQGGTIFSNYKGELLIKNVTHIGRVLPFLEYHIFKTGRLWVESAGTSLAEIQFFSMENTDELREKILHLLRAHGFSLTRETLHQKTSQNRWGLVVDTLSLVFSMMVTFGLMGYSIMGEKPKEKKIFSLPPTCKAPLDEASLSPTVRKKFAHHNHPLSQKARVEVIEPGWEWTVTDGDSKYTVKKRGKQLKVYTASTLPWEYIIPIGIFLALVVLLVALQYFFTNLSARYFIYNDAVLAKTHFLTLYETLIPMENLADVSLNQGIIKRLLSLYDNRISCQGSGKEVIFRNLTNGENIRILLGTHIQKTRDLFQEKDEVPLSQGAEGQPIQEATGSSQGGPSQDGPSRGEMPRDEREKDFETNFSMAPRRVYFGPCALGGLAILAGIGFTILGPNLPPDFLESLAREIPMMESVLFFVPSLLLLLFSLVVGIHGYIILKSTSYSVCSQSFVKNYRFLTTQLIEFTTDKVTGLVVRRDIPDRLMGTCSLRFDSIGSEASLVFQHIEHQGELVSKILAKKAIREREARGQWKSTFSLGSCLLANPWLFLLFPLLLAGWLISEYIPLAGFGLLFLMYLYGHFYYNSARITLFDSFIRFKIGIFTLTTYYVRYEEIKDLLAIQYPFLTVGSLQFDYAGEHQIMANQKGQNQGIVSNHFTMAYLADVFQIRQAVDLILSSQKPSISTSAIMKQIRDCPPRPLYQSKPRMSHGLFELILGLIILDGCSLTGLVMAVVQNSMSLLLACLALIPFGIFNLIYLLLSFYYIRSIDYLVEQDRLVKDWGIFFQAQKSVNFSKVDIIGKDQGFWHRYFKTGLLSINTIGSGMTELAIDRIPDYEECYKIIQEHYKS